MKQIGKIQLLPLEVIEKIAAGEVIERPASVVKELVENAIDAESSCIDITIEDAGLSLIRIVDNGCGMKKEDLQQCLQRHATSKIAHSEDLYSITTLGFRGEALFSVAAVSRLKLVSSHTTDGLGWAVCSSGGQNISINPHQHPRGSSVECRDLFFNVPARKKFLKSHKAESMAITRLIEQLVIAFPSVHFTYTLEGKRVLDLPQVNSPLVRIAQIGGTTFAKELIVCNGSDDGISAEIYISRPQDAKKRPRFQNLYVNLRHVDNDSVSYAIYEAFSRFITTQLKPSWFCFLAVDTQKIDINTHPAKQKIKFDNPKAVFSFLFQTAHRAIQDFMDINSVASNNHYGQFSDKTGNESEYTSQGNDTGQNNYKGIADESTSKPQQLFEKSSSSTQQALPSDFSEEATQMSLSFLSVLENTAPKEKGIEKPPEKNVQLTEESWSLIPCYQIHRTFILAPTKGGIILIDQHAAHERILYEEALKDLEHGASNSQQLLFPVIFEITATEKEILLSAREYFNVLGFEVQDFGGNTVAVSSMPATGFISSSQVEEAIREMVYNLIEEKDTKALSEPQHRFAASFACGCAIKKGQLLKQEEMNSLLNNLFATKNPYICPHGRPTLIRISLDEISRRFLR